MVRLQHKIAELIRPCLRTGVKPRIQRRFIRQEDRLAVVEPRELGVRVSSDDCESPDGPTCPNRCR